MSDAAPLPLVLARLEATYGLRVDGCTPVASYYRPAAVYRVSTDAGPVCLKPFRYPERRLRQMLAGMDHLHKRGFNAFAGALRGQCGERYLSCEGALYLVTHWVAGRPCEFGRAEDRQAAAACLGAFHAAALGCQPSAARRGDWPARHRRLLSDLQAMAALAASGPRPDTPDPQERERCQRFDRLFSRWVATSLTAARAASAAIDSPVYARLAQRADEQGEHCHGDYVAPNLLIDPAGAAVIIDLDSWSAELRLYDLAKLVSNAAGWRAGAAMTMLEAYGARLPLTADERALLPASVQPPREFWWAGICRYRRRRCDQAVLSLLELAVASIPEREAFLRELRRRLASG